MKKRHYVILAVFLIVLIGFLLPQKFQMPVEGATSKDYNPESFWYYPWGRSVTHKGVDIFAPEGTKLYPAAGGLVIYSGKLDFGGNVVLILGPKWRLHYYAHLQETKARRFTFVSKKDLIGTVGSSGNAAGKPPHLHYSVMTIIPYIWKIDKSKQGWKKMFYLNPVEYLQAVD
jgi:murein DD-endopeptidase MepM/ murein hydrolase activator NlpD